MTQGSRVQAPERAPRDTDAGPQGLGNSSPKLASSEAHARTGRTPRRPKPPPQTRYRLSVRLFPSHLNSPAAFPAHRLTRADRHHARARGAGARTTAHDYQRRSRNPLSHETRESLHEPCAVHCCADLAVSRRKRSSCSRLCRGSIYTRSCSTSSSSCSWTSTGMVTSQKIRYS